MSKQDLILLYGGRSAEREVSVLSAESVMRAIDYQAFSVQTYFITQSGDFIQTQAFEEKPADDEKLMTNETVDWSKKVLKMPYVGCGILASSVAMDKITTKRVLESAGIPQVPYVAVVEGDDIDEKIAAIEATLSYPVFTKPSNMGSSVGISKSENQTELRTALELAFKYDSRVLVEQGVNAREIEVGLLGNYDVKSTLPGEVVKDVAFYDYDAKYIDNKITMAIPAQLDPEVVKIMQTNAEKAFRAIGGLGLARCDFFYTDKGEIFLNELNTMPGFTQWSMYPLLWDNMALNYTDLITKLVELGKEVFQKHEAHLL